MARKMILMNGAMGDVLSLLDFASGQPDHHFQIIVSVQFMELELVKPKNVSLHPSEFFAKDFGGQLLRKRSALSQIYAFAGGRIIPDLIRARLFVKFPADPSKFMNKFQWISDWLDVSEVAGFQQPVAINVEQLPLKTLFFVSGGNPKSNSGFKNLNGKIRPYMSIANFTNVTMKPTDYQNIPELIALIKTYDAIVSVDSAPLYLSLILGKKSVGLFGPTRPDFFLNSYHRAPEFIPNKFPCNGCYEAWNVNRRQGCLVRACMEAENFCSK